MLGIDKLPGKGFEHIQSVTILLKENVGDWKKFDHHLPLEHVTHYKTKNKNKQHIHIHTHTTSMVWHHLGSWTNLSHALKSTLHKILKIKVFRQMW